MIITVKQTCRICGNNQLSPIFDFGSMPPANTLVSKSDFAHEQPFPLQLMACFDCAFMQLRHVVAPDLLFRDYAYMSSSSQTYLDHFSTLADTLITRFKFPARSLVVDIGSNDGSLLKAFQVHKMHTLGIDPARNLARLAAKQGVQTVCAYFTEPTAKKLVQKYGPARLITATNVFAHIDNLQDFLAALDILLTKDGIFFAQFPSLVDLLEKNAFDTIYHEHLSYFSITALKRLFGRNHLDLFDVDYSPIHGGSLRIFVQKKGGGMKKNNRSIHSFLEREQQFRLHEPKPYMQFAQNVQKVERNLRRLLKKLRDQKKKIVGLGAPAKGVTLINILRLGTKEIDFITDSTPSKQGLYTPASHIPIFQEEVLRKWPPDVGIIFAWNFADEIIQKTQFLKKRGFKYIIPVPKVTVIS